MGKKKVKMIMKFQELDLRYKYVEKNCKGPPLARRRGSLAFPKGEYQSSAQEGANKSEQCTVKLNVCGRVLYVNVSEAG